MKKHSRLGQVELEVLRVVGERAPITVGEVAEHFARTEGKARTTILTIMEKLRAKGFLTRRKLKGSFHYSPTRPPQDVVQGVIRRFVSETLRGSVSPFIAYLTDTKDITDDELRNLKSLVQRLDDRRKEEK